MQQYKQNEARYAEDADGGGIEKVQPQRKAGDRRGEAEQKQREEAQRRVEQHPCRESERCGKKAHGGGEQKNAQHAERDFIL